MRSKENYLSALKFIATFSLLALAFLVMASRFWALTIDDAYISARYAWNAAHGLGLTFNPTEHVMGYTNLLLVLIESVVYRWGGDGILAAKIVGVVAALCLLALTYGVAQQLDARRWRQVGTLAAVSLILFPELALGAVMGLESALFAALFLAALWIFLKWLWQGSGSYLAQGALALTLLCATLTRPEGLGLAFFLLMAQFFVTWQRRREEPFTLQVTLRTLAQRFLWLLLYGVLLLPILLWLNNYYGSPIPNTFFAKTAAGLAWDKYRAGIGYIARWVATSGVFWLLPLVLWPFLQRQVAATTRLVGLLTLYWLAYITYTGGDWIQGFRFLLPVLPLLYLLGAMGMVQIWQSVQGGLTHLTPTTQRLLAILLLCALWMPAFVTLRSSVEEATTWAKGYRQAHQEIAEWLTEATPPTTTIALMDVGIIGFGSQRPVLDIAGLVNRDVASLMHADGGWIASSTATAARIADYTLAHRPEVVILAHNSAPAAPFLSHWSHDTAIYNNPEFQADYELLFVREHRDVYYLSVYARKELSFTLPALTVVNGSQQALASLD